MGSENNSKIKVQAQKVVATDEESIEAYWFPAEKEIRLVEIEANIGATQSGQLEPFYFQPSPTDGRDNVLAIAIIRPEEFGKLSLPPDWGTWDKAIKVKST
jgi:hypothetical protein